MTSRVFVSEIPAPDVFWMVPPEKLLADPESPVIVRPPLDPVLLRTTPLTAPFAEMLWKIKSATPMLTLVTVRAVPVPESIVLFEPLMESVPAPAVVLVAVMPAPAPVSMSRPPLVKERLAPVAPVLVNSTALKADVLIALLVPEKMMLPLALIVDQPWKIVPPPLSAWASVLALALVCSAFAYVLYFKLIDRAGATNALLVTLLVPPVAILLGALFLGELLHFREFVGLGLIALGLAAIDGRILSLLWPRRLPRAA